ncbi:MAG: cell division protein ZapA [Nitrospinota bacterium]
MSGQAITVKIHGREYALSTIQDAEYTKNLAGYCDWMMKNLASSSGSTDYLRLTVLAMMQLAHNYYQMKDAAERTGPEMEAEIERLIKLIDKSQKDGGKKAKKKTA